MKKYVRSAYTFDPWKNADLSKWSDADIDLWNRIQWKDRNYTPVCDFDDQITGYATVYGVEGGPQREKARFVKEFSANTIYPPHYTIHEDDWADIYDKYKAMGYDILHPMYDGTDTVKDGVTYMVMDRIETQALYDMLSH